MLPGARSSVGLWGYKGEENEGCPQGAPEYSGQRYKNMGDYRAVSSTLSNRQEPGESGR